MNIWCLRIHGIEFAVVVVVKVDFVAGLFVFADLVDEGPSDDEVPDDGFVNFLKFAENGVAVTLHFFGLVLVKLNEGVRFAANNLKRDFRKLFLFFVSF